MSLLRLGALLALLQISAASQAAEAGTPAGASSEPWVEVNTGSGLITNLPAVNVNGLLAEMGEVRSSLQSRKEKLARAARASKFDLKDGLITVVVPGGLLYAMAVQQRHHRAMEKLAEVTVHLDNLTEEIIEFRSATTRQRLMAALR